MADEAGPTDPTEPTSVAAPAVRRGRRPSPRIAQMKRTWYFLRRNTLAMIGLAVLVIIALVAVYASTTPISWVQMPFYCSANYGPDQTSSGWYNSTTGTNGPFNVSGDAGCDYICTYELTPPPNAAHFCNGLWYKIPFVVTKDCIQPSFASCPSYPATIPPTVNLHSGSTGPMPLGSLATSIDSTSAFFNLYNGMLRGSDWSLIISVAVVGVGAALGLLVGATAGFLGGAVDDALMRLVDIFLSIPVLLFVIVLISVITTTIHSVGLPGFSLLGHHFKPYVLINSTWTPLFTLIIGFAAVWWPFYARLIRGQVLVVREQKYIEAARANGAGKGRILLRHIIPNSVYPMFIQFSLDVGTIPLLIGGLVFLGFTNLFPSPYFPEWGAISAWSVFDIRSMLDSCALQCVIPWWQLFFPGLALFMYAVSVNLLSDGLRDALDPRLRR
ncbi:MAG TPA: ABC transporter permease [Thermoplasmata archaeon]|nr:ABC transporter permease [Thermoplasmata archaeon]